MTQKDPDVTDRLQHLPVPLFASVMGLCGLTLALHGAEVHFDLPARASVLALVLSFALFGLIAVSYALKGLRHRAAVLAEWHHPVKMAFFPAISISLLLLGTALRPHLPEIARIIWLLGAVAQGALTLAVLSGWIGKRSFQIMQISPAWFIPAVGNVIVPVAGVPFGYGELSWLFFATGLLFWLVLLTLVMNRLMFHDPLPGKLLPTLAILIAPPAVSFLAWLQLNGGVLDPFARMLFYAAVTFATLVAVQAPGFLRIPFALSWWALSFPTAALTIAAFRYGALTGAPGFTVAAVGLLALLIAIVGALAVRTLQGVRSGEVFQPD